MVEMRGIAQMHFGPSHLKTMTLLLPDSLELQNRFAEFVRAADKSKLEMQQALNKLELLYKSLMQKCFSGEIYQ
jgi:type I restriction enzyme S subunit